MCIECGFTRCESEQFPVVIVVVVTYLANIPLICDFVIQFQQLFVKY